MLTTVSGSCIFFLMNSHYSRFYAQLSLRDYNNANEFLLCYYRAAHQYSGPSIISYREQIEKLSSTDNTRCKG